MASLSPNHASSPPYGGPGPQDQDRNSPMSLNIGFFKSLTEKRTTRDGQPPKRRGPKPDSKPALTRRQELNRQAQRTHRERKELYIKALEDEVLRLKEIFSAISQDKERLAEENRQLRALLVQNGLSTGAVGGSPTGGPGSALDDSASNPTSGGYASSASLSGSYAPPSGSITSAFTPPSVHAAQYQPAMSSLSPGPGQSQAPGYPGHSHSPSGGQGLSAGAMEAIGGQPAQARNPNLDYDQAGIDFVLTLEKPCMDHMPWLLERRTETGGAEPCGHVLMASCPPEPFADLNADIPFGRAATANNNHNNSAGSAGLIRDRNGGGVGKPGEAVAAKATTAAAAAAAAAVTAGGSGAAGVGNGTSSNMINNSPSCQVPRPTPQTWQLNKADLSTLLDLSMRLNLDGEITPVMAWGMVLGHPRLGELGAPEFERLRGDLVSKVRCYGFGAVLEEFEVRDAINAVLAH